jgi:enoyl-CoA hydratase
MASKLTPASEFTQIRYEVESPIARIVLNRPKYKNAQSRVLREEMDAAFALAETDDDVRVAILSGEGDHFSSGHDLGTPEETADLEERPYKDGLIGRYDKRWDLNVANTLRWRDFPKPTIAQVHGFCIYGGWTFAAGMDIIIASEDAKFLPSLLQYFSVPWDVGVRRAKEILFTGRFITAAEALEFGFINQVVPREELEATATAMATKIAEKDSFGLRMIKEAVNSAQDIMGFRAAIRVGMNYNMLRSEEEKARLGLPDFGENRQLSRVGESLRDQ